MTQNRSHAVMAQRFESRESLDDFPTPPWATRALFEHVIKPKPKALMAHTAWEPACNRGFMVRVLREHFGHVIASDVADYGFADGHIADFTAEMTPAPRVPLAWIITNPPFNAAEKFATRAWSLVHAGVALLVRTQWLEGVGRYERLFRKYRPATVAQFVERVPMVRGRCDAKASTATAYCWELYI